MLSFVQTLIADPPIQTPDIQLGSITGWTAMLFLLSLVCTAIITGITVVWRTVGAFKDMVNNVGKVTEQVQQLVVDSKNSHEEREEHRNTLTQHKEQLGTLKERVDRLDMRYLNKGA